MIRTVRRGALLHARSEVFSWARTGGGRYEIGTRGGTLQAKHVVYATNGFMPEHLRRDFHGCTLTVISAIGEGLPRRYLPQGLRRAYLHTGLAIANWLDSRRATGN